MFTDIDSLTQKQEEYIKILSSYPDTRVEDEKDIQDFLRKHAKTTISQLTKQEASDLIKVLLQRLAEYIFACGKKVVLPKQEVNCYQVLGQFEGCLHACPDDIDVHCCEYWKKHNDDNEP